MSSYSDISQIWVRINHQGNAKTFWSPYYDVKGSIFQEVKNFISGPTDYDHTSNNEWDLEPIRATYKSFKREAVFLLRMRAVEGNEDRETVLKYFDYLLSEAGDPDIKDFVERQRIYVTAKPWG